MANPKVENGHIDIANEIADKLCRYRLPGQEWQILWVIIRQTWGWLSEPNNKHSKKKSMDKIPLNQFVKETGIDKRKCKKLLNSLLEKKIIKRGVQKDTSIIVSYGIQSNFDKWKAVSKRTPVPKRTPAVVSKKTPVRVPKRTPSKDILKDIIKDNVLRTAKSPNWIPIIVKQHTDAFKSKNNGESPAPVNYGKIGRTFKPLYEQYGLEKLQKYLKFYMTMNDRYVIEAGYPLELFPSQINKIIARIEGTHKYTDTGKSYNGMISRDIGINDDGEGDKKWAARKVGDRPGTAPVESGEGGEDD